ncbi:RNA-binding protein 4 [Trypanosoma cruzi]|uniref:RNA-binding protein 4 n=1 Tax=Trypanosoma cruzi TaxID=5693 RepID=A0A7J6YBT9_TRYCR|nr:RNA-binding protein 4 [Trypanosoma cruzi]
MNANLFYTQQRPEHQHHGPQQQQQQQPAGSGFLLPAAPFTAAGPGATNVFAGFCMPPSAPCPQQQQQQRQEQGQTLESNVAAANGLLLATQLEAKDGRRGTASFSGAIPDVSNSIWATQEPNSSTTTALQSLNASNSINYPPFGIKYMVSPTNASASAQETPNQTYLYPVSMQSEEAAPTLMLLPTGSKDGSSSMSPAYYVLVNSPQASGAIHYTNGTMQPPHPTSFILGANSSTKTTTTNSFNAAQQPSPFQMPVGQQTQAVSSNLGISWPPQFASNMATTTTGVFPGLIENPRPPQVDTAAFPSHGQRAYYTSAVFTQSLNSTPSPTLCGHRRPPSGSGPAESGTMRSRSSRNSGTSINSIGAGGSGGQEMERRGGLPFEEDPIPIDTTKTQLIVNFLPQFLTDDGFRELFTPFGEIHTKPTKIIYDRGARRGKGYGFVYYKDGRSTEAAIKTINGLSLGGRRLKVRYADQQRGKIDCDSCVDEEEKE